VNPWARNLPCPFTSALNFTYRYNIENGKLDFGDYPGENVIGKPAKVLDADQDGMLLLAERIPDQIRPSKVLERSDASRMIAPLSGESLEMLLETIPAT
jgi:hypothetical protein